MTEYLTVEDLLLIARNAIGGRPVVRDFGLLSSSAWRPQSAPFGLDPYPTIQLKAAALLHSLTSNHALLDGNKRLAWLATYTFLAINGYRLDAPDDAGHDLVLAIAASELEDVDKIAERLSAFITAA